MDATKALLITAQQVSADLAAAAIRQERVMADERSRAQSSLVEVCVCVGGGEGEEGRQLIFVTVVIRSLIRMFRIFFLSHYALFCSFHNFLPFLSFLPSFFSYFSFSPSLFLSSLPYLPICSSLLLSILTSLLHFIFSSCFFRLIHFSLRARNKWKLCVVLTTSSTDKFSHLVFK